MANNWLVWKWTRTGWVLYIYIIEKRSCFSQIFPEEENDEEWGIRGAESAIIRHVIIRPFVLGDSGIENNWPAQIFEQRTNGLESIPRVYVRKCTITALFLSQNARTALTSALLSLSLSLFLIYDPSNNVHLLFTPVLFTRKIVDYRTCSCTLQTLLSFAIKFLRPPLQTFPFRSCIFACYYFI